MRVWIGIDIGAISVKMALLLPKELHLNTSENFPFAFSSDSNFFNEGALAISPYLRHQGDPFGVVQSLLQQVVDVLPENTDLQVLTTGSGGRLWSRLHGTVYVNEFQALATAIGTLYPHVHTIFEMGGETSKYIQFERDANAIRLTDYETNGECAAGTGSFFDQQVERLKFKLENVGDLVLRTERSASIAGRCSVFAKSDMIHAQQRGYSPEEILKGLCHAVVRNFKGNIAKGKSIQSTVALVGGVAANSGVVQAFRDCFALSEEELIVPEYYAWAGALGAAMIGKKENSFRSSFSFFDQTSKPTYPTTEALSMEQVVNLRDQIQPFVWSKEHKIEAFLGIDVGSVSTNLALIDPDGNVIHSIYCMTDGRPIEVVRQALKEMAASVEDRVIIQGVGTTGSGRELIGMLVGADTVKDEITAHKTGAIHVSQKFVHEPVDTIFEIGGQDAKFISIRDGVVVDFTLNDACAAGTGSFLEEQANQLGIQIKEEFASLALSSEHPLKLGERCTVFMEKEMNPYLQMGVAKKDIVAGLAISVVHNYLNRVVKKRPIGNVIFFQGGTAYNDSVAAAFSTVLRKRIIVPPHNGVMGAIGAALLAKQVVSKSEANSLFRGWNLDHIQWELKEFTCQGCSNNCQIQAFKIENETAYWGDKCSDKYRKRTLSLKKPVVADLLSRREETIQPFFQISKFEKKRGRMGVPFALSFHDRLPFWKTYLETLGFEVVLSPMTNRHIVNQGLEISVAEPCFPVQASHGHLFQFLEATQVDHVLMPIVVNEEDPQNSPASFICPWAQTFVLMAKHNPAFDKLKDRMLFPAIYFREGEAFVEAQLRDELSSFKIGKKENRAAVRAGYQAQQTYKSQLLELGKSALDQLEQTHETGVVFVGRPYNLYDTGLNLNLPSKLRDLYGVNVIPMDFLPINNISITDIHDHMFWNYGRKILQTSRFLRDYPKLQMIYISNFKCGPDSYVRHFVEDALQRPFLFLQLDSHSNDAGVMTRVEAFLESKGMM